MARMIKSTYDILTSLKLSTVFEDGTQTDRLIKPGDIVENLRYVKNGDIEVVSGEVKGIDYSINASTWDPSNPSDTLSKDMKLINLTIDASEHFKSNIIKVPINEIVEFEDETDVARMRYAPSIVCEMTLKYSNNQIQNVSIEVGDVFDKVRILDPANIGTDIVGKFEVLGFAYKMENFKVVITGLGLKNVDTEETLVIDFKQILAMSEVYNYEAPDEATLREILAELGEGDTVVISGAIDTSAGKAINVSQKNISIVMNDEITADGSKTSGIHATGNGSLTLSGTELVVNNTPYNATHSSGAVTADGNSTLTFNGSGVKAVIADDPANKGQFGVVINDSAKIVVNDGVFEAGWYCIAGNGSTTTKDAVVEINGGVFKSVADYALYHPYPGKLVINGGKISGAAGALAANNGTIEINGGEFSVLGGGNTGEWGDGTSGLSDVAINLNAKYGDIVCRITDGTFYATAAGTIMIKTGTAHTVDLKISGGKFTSKPNDEWLEEGYLCTGEPDEEGFYKVYKALL